jgi:hypothetical protein
MTELQDNPLRDLSNARNLSSDTPETDAMSMTDDPLDYIAIIEKARKLERERDEWRKAAFEITSQANESRMELKRQLDEAREEFIELQALELNNEGACVRLKEERDETRLVLANASNRVQTILDEGFGPQPVDAIENNLSLLERKIYEARAELARLTGKLGDMHEANKLIQGERDYARNKATKAWESHLKLDTENRRLERKLEELRLAYNEAVAEPPLKFKRIT